MMAPVITNGGPKNSADEVQLLSLRGGNDPRHPGARTYELIRRARSHAGPRQRACPGFPLPPSESDAHRGKKNAGQHHVPRVWSPPLQRLRRFGAVVSSRLGFLPKQDCRRREEKRLGMARIRKRRGKYVVDYRDAAGIRRWVHVPDSERCRAHPGRQDQGHLRARGSVGRCQHSCGPTTPPVWPFIHEPTARGGRVLSPWRQPPVFGESSIMVDPVSVMRGRV
jgi:hypothetical protein